MTAVSSWYNKSATRSVWVGVGAPVVGLVLIMMAFSVALLWSFARQQDDEFARGSRQLVENAFKARQASLADMTLDYANWDAAVAATARRPDSAWLEQHYYSAVLDGIVVFREAATRYDWVEQSIEAPSEAVDAMLRSARNTPDIEAFAAASDVADGVGRTATLLDGRLAMIAVAPITHEDRARRLAHADSGRPLDFIAAMQIIERAETEAIGANLGLHDFRVLPADAGVPRNQLVLPITAASGEAVAIVTWRHNRPGTAGFARLAGAVVFALLLMGCVALLIARRLVAWQLALAAREHAAHESARLKTEFIATMSHELRTPLNAIVGYAEMIEEDAEATGAVGASIQKDAGSILGAARHLSKMISDILEQSRLEAGKLTLEPEPLIVSRALAEVAELIEPAARAKSLRVITALDSHATEVFADPTRMRQCLLNLAGNAVKFTDQGCVTLRARAIDESGRAMLAIDVIDSGIGIAPDDMQRLFSPFVQANAEIASRYGGAGLGLSISRKLARAMGGDIVATSEPGKGSMFTLLLPRSLATNLRAA